MLGKLTREYIQALKVYRKSPSNCNKIVNGVFIHPVVYTTFFVIRETPILKQGFEVALDRLIPEDPPRKTNKQ
mgnify:CR=1 FL=1